MKSPKKHVRFGEKLGDFVKIFDPFWNVHVYLACVYSCPLVNLINFTRHLRKISEADISSLKKAFNEDITDLNDI